MPKTLEGIFQQTLEPMLKLCWAGVADVGPALNQPDINLSCLFGYVSYFTTFKGSIGKIFYKYILIITYAYQFYFRLFTFANYISGSLSYFFM